MIYETCSKCKLSLPRYLMTPAIAQKGKQKSRVWFCNNCTKELNKNYGK